VDVPSAPQVCKQMAIKAYPCIERGGHRLGLHGPEGQAARAARSRVVRPPDTHVFVSKRLQESNYLQAMEGGIDTAHVSYVHKYEMEQRPHVQGREGQRLHPRRRNVVFDIERNDFGLTLYGRRNGEPDSITGASRSGSSHGSR
jgi:phenylpropionate dioxygenase-like ring-hydroxylating dioxygenase large terminal subunit